MNPEQRKPKNVMGLDSKMFLLYMGCMQVALRDNHPVRYVMYGIENYGNDNCLLLIYF